MEIVVGIVKYGLIAALAVEAALIGRALWQVVRRRAEAGPGQE